MENNMTNYFHAYSLDSGFYSCGWTCPSCGQWVNPTSWHICSGISYCPTYYPVENKTERAYQIIRTLVQEKIIPEPGSYQIFCDLIEAIKKVI